MRPPVTDLPIVLEDVSFSAGGVTIIERISLALVAGSPTVLIAAGGAQAEVFASANMEHPQALATAGKSGSVVLFARNRLCALVRPGLAVEPATILDRMLDPHVKLGTSTPRADPSGDYAWEVFRKADRLRPGAFAALATKAAQ